MRVGFTGTRDGLTTAQTVTLARLVAALCPTVMHHGDCIGADETAHHVARAAGARLALHPPTIATWRARCEVQRGDDVMLPAPYLTRNAAIVEATLAIIACPREERGERRRSGTWSTMRHARRLRRPVYIIRPSGRIERERT